MPERTTYDYEGPGVDPRVQVVSWVGRQGGAQDALCAVWTTCATMRRTLMTFFCLLSFNDLQAAINAAFADDGEFLFVGAAEGAGGRGGGQNVYDADAVGAMEASGGPAGRPGSAGRRRPDSARRSSKVGLR